MFHNKIVVVVVVVCCSGLSSPLPTLFLHDLREPWRERIAKVCVSFATWVRRSTYLIIILLPILQAEGGCAARVAGQTDTLCCVFVAEREREE